MSKSHFRPDSLLKGWTLDGPRASLILMFQEQHQQLRWTGIRQRGERRRQRLAVVIFHIKEKTTEVRAEAGSLLQSSVFLFV